MSRRRQSRQNMVARRVVAVRLEISRSGSDDIYGLESTGGTLEEAYAFLEGYVAALGGTESWQVSELLSTQDGWLVVEAELVPR